MPPFITYYMGIKEKSREGKMRLRLELVRYAQEKGIREAARAFWCSHNTIELWLRRFRKEGVSGLSDRSRAPHRIPHKTGKELEEEVIKARLEVPCYGPARLKEMFLLKPSIGAIGRILREKGLVRKPKKRYQKKRDLRKVKAEYNSLSHHQVDVKHLYDIPKYWPQMMHLKLPKYQYTIRDTKSGALILAFAFEYSVSSSITVAERYLDYLKSFGIQPEEIIFQTDCGTEFSGGKRKMDRGFSYTVEKVQGAKHCFIPPGCSNANADVESSHAIIEHELYDLERFTSVSDFLTKACIYQYYFNFVRPNFHKGKKTPWQIIQEERPGISQKVLSLQPIILDNEFRRYYNKDKGVCQDVPVLPGIR